MKTKAFPLETKALENPGEFEGYASVFGVRDLDGESVMPGAFSESIATHRRQGTWPLMLWQHQASAPIGVWEDLADDGKGLRAKGRLLINENVPDADKVYTLIKNRAVRGLSIGYFELDAVPATNGEPRKLLKLELVEVSIVSFPANRRALVDAVKSKSAEHWERLEAFAKHLRDGEPRPIREFEDILRDAGVPKALATQIASVGYAKSIRSESGGDEAKNRAVADAFAELRALVDGLTIPSIGDS